MSYNKYDLDGIKAELRKELEEARAKLAAWQAVTFPTKKDGSPFKLMSKNISGATYYAESWAMQPGEYRIRVSFYAPGTGYTSDSLDAHCLVKDLDEVKRAKVQNFQPKAACLAQVYTYDIDDIKQAVAARIDFLTNRVSSLERQIVAADQVYAEFREALFEAVSKLNEAAGDRSTLRYLVYDTVVNNCRYH